MKGGKAGRGRKSSSTRSGAKGTARGGARKKGGGRNGNPLVRPKEKRTTKLGAVRVPDDA